MIQKFISYLDEYIKLNEEEQQLVRELLPIRHYKKGEIILREGQVSNKFFFNLNGFVRLFYLKNGDERTAYFYPKGTFVSAYESFVKQIPSTLNLQVMEETSLVEISIESSVKMLEYSTKFEGIARIAMEDELIIHQKIIASLLTQTIEERYLNLIKESPEIFQKVPQLHIASYLGVRPESLSRIKKKIYE